MRNGKFATNTELVILGNQDEVARENQWLQESRSIQKKQKNYIAFLDILGFKEISKKPDKLLKELLEKFTGYAGKAIYKRTLGADELNRVGELKSQAELKILMVSDSIVIQSQDASYKSFATIVDVVIDLIRAGFISEVALRGYLTKSYLINCDLADENINLKMNILWSSGIVKAFEEEKNIEMAGCRIDPNCIPDINSFKKEYPQQASKIMTYNIPVKSFKIEKISDEETKVIKNFTTEKGFLVDWSKSPFFKSTYANPDGKKDAFTERIKKTFENANTEQKELDKSILFKLQNTINFYEFAKSST